MTDENSLLLGEMKGKMDMIIAGQEEIKQQLGRLDTRTRASEVSGARYGVTAALIMGVGIEFVKNKLGM